jgi:hypothetical protein
MSKSVRYYYKTTNQDNQTIFRCLYDGRYDTAEVKSLDIKNCRNFRMNDKYEATDDDLIQFCEDFLRFNEELKKPYFKNKDKTVIKVDMLNYNSTNDAVLNNVLMNSDQERINKIPGIDRREFMMLENCLSCGLMTLDRSYLETPFECFGYDYSKFYFYMMKKIRIPESAPVFYVMEEEELDYEKLDFGVYRIRVNCHNKDFMKVFNFNKTHHYSHNTLKLLYKFREKYGITFTLLPPDKEYNYNMVHYEKTVELKTLMRGFFNVMDTLLKQCSKSNWLVKSLMSQSWGTLSKYNKSRVTKEESTELDWDHLNNISPTEKYDYYCHKYENGVFTMMKANKAYQYGGIARIKHFLTEFSRGFVFNMLSTHDLAQFVVRIHTDGICFNRPINFPAFKLDYFPVPEQKTTGTIKFMNLNCYNHVCEECNEEFSFDKCSATFFFFCATFFFGIAFLVFTCFGTIEFSYS